MARVVRHKFLNEYDLLRRVLSRSFLWEIIISYLRVMDRCAVSGFPNCCGMYTIHRIVRDVLNKTFMEKSFTSSSESSCRGFDLLSCYLKRMNPLPLILVTCRQIVSCESANESFHLGVEGYPNSYNFGAIQPVFFVLPRTPKMSVRSSVTQVRLRRTLILQDLRRE